jgi:Outer membrane protein beta-barrel domain
MKKTLLFSIFCFFSMAHNVLNAQSEQHFRAGIAAGINLSQMEGDGQQGYHKVGLAIGAKGAYCFKPNFDVSAELMYNSRGSRSNPFSSKSSFEDKTIQLKAELNYADILLAANFHFMPNENYTFYRQSLQIGVSYGRLLSSTISTYRGIYHDDFVEVDVQNNLKKDDIGFVVGYSWFLTSRLGITAKHTFSLRNIYYNPREGATNRDYTSFVPYNLSLQVVYNLFSPKLNVKGQVEKERKKKERRKHNPLEDL